MPKTRPAKPSAPEKYEWRKTEKQFYLAKSSPELIDVLPMLYFAVDGAGSPDSEEFQSVVGLLYTLSYTIRMMPKSGWTPPDYREYTVFPLGGVWFYSFLRPSTAFDRVKESVYSRFPPICKP